MLRDCVERECHSGGDSGEDERVEDEGGTGGGSAQHINVLLDQRNNEVAQNQRDQFATGECFIAEGITSARRIADA